jgi:hypothetical protein
VAWHTDQQGQQVIFDIITGSMSDACLRIFNPASLFSSGTMGAWFDPSDFSTMFQDSAGTTPVTSVGQPVGKILDKSGNNKHATQSVSGSRPILQYDGADYYLSFDGVDDGLATPTINFSSTTTLTMFAGLYKNDDTLRGSVVESAPNYYSIYGGYLLSAPGTTGRNTTTLVESTAGGPKYSVGGAGGAAGDGSNTSAIGTTSNIFPAPIKNVITAVTNTALYAHNGLSMRVDSVPQALISYDTGITTLTAHCNAVMYIGSRNGVFPFNGRIYSLIALGRAATTQELTDTEAYIMCKSSGP